MAGTPFQLPDGTSVTSWDDASIQVTGQDGRSVIVARAAAPPELQQAVAAREPMPQPAPATTSRANPLSFIEGAPQSIEPPTPKPAPMTPAAPDDLTPDPVAGGMSSPMAAAQAEYARLRSMPQVAMGGGGERKTTSVTRMPESARADVLDAQTPVDEAQAERELAIEDMGSAEEKALGQVSQLHAEQGRNIQGEIDAQEALQQSHQQRYEAEQKKLEELNRQAQVEISPDRYWKEKGTGNKILAAISMAVGAFVHARSEGRVANTPMQLIQTAIERDIDAQKENRNRAERDVARQGSLMAMLSDKYESDIDRRNAALVLANEAVAKQIDGVAAGLQSEQAKAKAAELAAQLRQANAQRAQELVMSTAGSETVTTQQIPGGPVKTGAGKAADAMGEYIYGPDAKFSHDTYIPASMAVTGEARAANSKEDAVKINQSMATTQEILRKAAQIEEIAARGGKLSPQAKTEVASLYASLTLDVKNAEQAGALDAGTQQIVGEILGPKPTDMTAITTSIPRFKETVRAGARAAMRNRTHLVDPTTVPLAARQGMGISTQAAPPPTRPLAVEGTE